MGLLSFLKTSDTDPMNMFKWKKFPLNKYFDIVLSEGDNQAKLLENGSIPLVSAGSSNNGICKYISKGDGISQLFNGNVITVDMFGKAFYQPKPFYAVSHGRVNILIPKNGVDDFSLDRDLALFLVTMIEERIFQNYSFGDMCNSSRLKKDNIYLPVNDNGTPDWNSIRKYIKSLYSNAKKFVL